MKPAVLDSNLLLLLIVGTAGTELIGKHKRLDGHDADSFRFLQGILYGRERVIVTLHSLAEFWNLVGNRKRGADADHDRIIDVAIGLLSSIIEVHTAALQLARWQELRWIGLSDVAQLEAAQANGADLISADGALCHHAENRGVHSLSFWRLYDPILR